MRKLWVCAALAAALTAFTCPPGAVWAEAVSVELGLVPPDETNLLEMTLTATISGDSISDSDTATVTGSVTTDLEVYFDPATHQVADVNSMAFTGGRLYFSDVSFTLDLGIFGKIHATGTGIAATPTSPWGPGAVEGGNFNTIDHVLVVAQGLFNAYGTGIIGGFFDPVTIDLSVEPMEASADVIGTIAVSLEALDEGEATYNVVLNLPVQFDEIVLESEMVTVSVQGVGLVEAAGSFTRGICALRTDLAGDDCRVDGADLAAFCDQWLLYSDLIVCPLSADLAYDDCYVDFADFAILAHDWLGYTGP